MMANPDGAFDALLPLAMAEKAEQIGVKKAALDRASMFALAVLAGAFIALGAMFATTVLAGAADGLPYGVARLLAGLVFSQKTHFAGVMLIPTAFMMTGLASQEWRWVAVLLGLIVLGWITQNLVTKRCGINKLFGINSCSN